MKIIVEVTGWLKEFTMGMPSVELHVKQGLKASDVLSAIGVPRTEIGFISVRNAKADGDRLVYDDYIISDGDILRLYSPIVGG